MGCLKFRWVTPLKKINVAERVGFEPTVVLPTHAFQACALNHSAISPTVFPPAPNRMVIRQWTLIFHEFAPGASSFGTVMERGAHLALPPVKERRLMSTGARLWQSPAAARCRHARRWKQSERCGWSATQPRSTATRQNTRQCQNAPRKEGCRAPPSRRATVPGRSDVQTSKLREKLETAIGKHAVTSLMRYFQMPYPTRNRDKIFWTRGKLRNKVILIKKSLRTERSNNTVGPHDTHRSVD